ncbi:ribose 5-phosphate isomerase B [Vagococcus acidifermentans]|uniref:Ribose 5-phosphate isomerase B n=1 Tax=Vagococcus acidifermentans TaxID=564710 RepID=A0A430B2W1_9ENTE|nr:ribose 5-phosphate isomerase B [Vagococcus acidifermentans]RSU14676.1 ribose 5-phosphate isomerase B [Vagococcus acidifermentans]
MASVVVGSDHGGFRLKQVIKDHLEKKGHSVLDVGCFSEESVDFPVYASAVCEEVLKSDVPGILICGTGVGMSMAANKHHGIRASLVGDVFTAQATRAHNNSNVLCLGERVTGSGLALMIVDTWLDTPFEGGRHMKRVNMLDEL